MDNFGWFGAIGFGLLMRFVYVLLTALGAAANPAGIPYHWLLPSLQQILMASLSAATWPGIFNIVQSFKKIVPAKTPAADVSPNESAVKKVTKNLEGIIAQAERAAGAEILTTFGRWRINRIFAEHDMAIAAAAVKNGENGIALLKTQDVPFKNLLLARHLGITRYRLGLENVKTAAELNPPWDGVERRKPASGYLRSGRRKYDLPPAELMALLRTV
jgi:hypothetical protein